MRQYSVARELVYVANCVNWLSGKSVACATEKRQEQLVGESGKVSESEFAKLVQ